MTESVQPTPATPPWSCWSDSDWEKLPQEKRDTILTRLAVFIGESSALLNGWSQAEANLVDEYRRLMELDVRNIALE